MRSITWVIGATRGRSRSDQRGAPSAPAGSPTSSIVYMRVRASRSPAKILTKLSTNSRSTGF